MARQPAPTPQSQKRNRALIALVFVLFVLVSLGQFLTQEKTPDSRTLFTTLQGHQVTKIAIEYEELPELVFEKLENSWYLTKPFKRQADNSRIQVLLATLSLPKNTIYSSQEADPADLGLKPPKAVLTLNDTDFYFGNKETNNNRRYLQTGDKVTLSADIVYPLFSQGLFGFVDKSLVPPGFVSLESSSYTLSKTAGVWQTTGDSGINPASLFKAWSGHLAEDILTWPLASPEVLQTAIKHQVKLAMQSGTELTLEIFEMPKLSLLHPTGAGYALAITPTQFSSLGLIPD